jgi:hypothetical protein
MKLLRGIVGEDCAIDAHDYGNRFIVCADEKPTAFLELESATRGCSESS